MKISRYGKIFFAKSFEKDRFFIDALINVKCKTNINWLKLLIKELLLFGKFTKKP